MPIPNTVQVGGVIAPGAVQDTYPVTNPKYGLGGLRTVTAYSDLALIPEARREEGMMVYVSGGATPAYYSYINSSWVLFSNDTTVSTNSANWNSVYTSVNNASGSWDNAYNTGTVYQTNSADYATIQFSNNKFLPLSGGTLDNGGIEEVVLKIQGSADKLLIGTGNATGLGISLSSVNSTEDKMGTFNIVASTFNVKTADGRTTFNVDKDGKVTIGDSNYFPYTLPEIDGNEKQILVTDGSGTVTWKNGSYVISDVASTSAQWNSVYLTVSALSASWEESAEILPTVTNYLSTNNVLLSAATITEFLSTNTIYSDGTAGIISDNINEAGNGTNTLTLAFQNGIFVEDNLNVAGSLSANTILSDGSAGIISDNINETGNGTNTLTLAFQNGIFVEDDLNVVGSLSASTILSDGSAGIISDDINETGNGVNTLTLAFQQGVYVENNLNVVGSLSATTILSDGSAGIISDDISETGNGLNTLTLAFQNGVYVENNLTVLNLISTGSYLTSKDWASNYTTTNTNSGNWSRNIHGVRVLNSSETEIDALSSVHFIKNITEQNVFTYLNFAVGQTIYIYLSASHNEVLQHYFPLQTYFSSNGNSNVLYTFENYVTVVSITNTGNYYLGTTNIINTGATQYSDLGDYLLINPLGFILQENNDRILLE